VRLWTRGFSAGGCYYLRERVVEAGAFMSLTIPLSPQAEAGLKQRAAAAGLDVETYTAHVLEAVAKPRTLEELSGPVRQRFIDSGATEDELGEELEKAKHEMRAERRGRQRS
jgi:hypothetical protein